MLATGRKTIKQTRERGEKVQNCVNLKDKNIALTPA